MSARKSSSSSSIATAANKRLKTKDNNDDEQLPLDVATMINKDSLLFKYASHSDASFHNFTTPNADSIRNALLTWYRSSRRKLPWRGDPPPYDGSTAGINNGSAKKANSNQASIKNFFGSKKTEEKKTEDNEKDAADVQPAIPVTGYGVWVSEIMLQQTRVEAVIPYYLKWMKSFPTVHDLAAASEEEVNSHWAGLGFYRRARLLHKGAKRVVEEYNGELPRTVEGLQKLDGIGRYTASAIASIAFDVCVPVVDGNVCRVLSRLTGIANHIKAPVLKDDLGWALAEQIVQAGDGKHAGEVNQALMELGATYCAPSGTGMDDRDPLKSFYMSTKLGMAFAEERRHFMDCGFDGLPVTEYLKVAGEASDCSRCKLCGEDGIETLLIELHDAFETTAAAKTPSEFCPGQAGHSVFPLAPPKAEKREEVLAVAVLSHSSSSSDASRRWLLVKRPEKGLLAGQFEFPSVSVWNSSDEPAGRLKKRKDGAIEVPTISKSVRERALSEFLGELVADGSNWIESIDRSNVGDSPLEHIFSHVRHTMWLEYCQVDEDHAASINDALEWTAPNGRHVRWMSEEDMKKVGVTSGVKKILKAVNKTTKQTTKRKR